MVIESARLARATVGHSSGSMHFRCTVTADCTTIAQKMVKFIPERPRKDGTKSCPSWGDLQNEFLDISLGLRHKDFGATADLDVAPLSVEVLD